ncbi:MAG TPA: addiction module protein [Gemmataceae bacterium]|jgi:hypothetical protein|nr:addiction module protein [Gemmataceae bacterium]
MSAKLAALGIDRLSVAERIALIEEIWDSIASEVEQAPLSEVEQQEETAAWPAIAPIRRRQFPGNK